MIVVDASVAFYALTFDGVARSIVGDGELCAPHLIDAEVLSMLRRQVLSGALPAVNARRALERWPAVGVQRFSHQPLLARAWSLRSNLTAYDALYVALAEGLGCDLATSDVRMSRAPGIRCSVRIVAD